MRTLALLVVFALPLVVSAQLPVLKQSDVVFMYQAPHEIYNDYGATVLAWGGTPKPDSLRAAEGLKFFGSVGMVTEFNRYYEFDPKTYMEGLCRDLQSQPFKVPWLTDHQHKGIPYWWCCTRQPRFQNFIRARVRETVEAGAYGVHIDDHLGTAGALWSGGCFCERCVAEFRAYLKAHPEICDAFDVDPVSFNYAKVLREWLAVDPNRKATGHPLWPQWRVYQLRGAAAFMTELRELAAKTGGRPVPMSANACLTWGPHLNDYPSVDFFSAEVEHHASNRAMNEDPVVAYRMADAVNRPLASTASGGDWAFIKEHNLHGLVRGWIVLGYAAGHSLMAPHRQWCYTPEKGTHWYEGPIEQFAPLYRFARENATVFDNYEPWVDVIVAYAQDIYDADPGLLMMTCRKLLEASLSYRLALAGNEAVPRSLAPSDFRGTAPVLILKPDSFNASARSCLTNLSNERKFADLNAALSHCRPAVRVVGETTGVRLFPRVKQGSTAIHIVNWNYEPSGDRFTPARHLKIKVDRDALRVNEARTAIVHRPGCADEVIRLEAGTDAIELPEIPLWGIIEIQAETGK